MRITSGFEIVEESPGQVSFRIHGPLFEFLDDEEPEEEEDES